MDYHINGIDYLVLDNKNKNNKTTYNNNSFEFELLKNWLVFSKEPKTQKQIEIFSTRVEFILNHKIYGWKYENKNDKNNIKLSDVQTLKIPENYLRFKKLLDIDYNDI